MDSSSDNNILRDDVLLKIIESIPLAQWPQLELVSKQFERCTRRAHRALTSLNLKKIFLAKFGKYSLSEDKLQQFFTKLILYCPNLRTITGFDCFSSTVTFPHLELLGNLPQLKNISLKDCTLNFNVFCRVLKKFPLMKSLEINKCRFVNDFGMSIANEDLVNNDLYFEFFENFCGLIELTIYGYRIFSGRFLSLINAENLKVLNFSASKFHASYLSALLNRCFNLETLFLYDPLTSVNSVGLELEVLQCLPSLPKLRKFQLCVNIEGDQKYSSDDLLNVLARCKSLRDIRLDSEDVELVTDEFLRRLIVYCPLLESLVLDIWHCYSREILSKIADLENLTTLCLQNCQDDNLLIGLCSRLEKLKKLANLCFLECVIGEDALCSLKSLKSLTYFRFTVFGDVTGRVVRDWIATGFLKNLKTLDLQISDVSLVKAISENSPVLKEFNILADDINDEDLLSIAKNCKCLQTLNLSHCSGVSENGLLKFLSQCSSLRLLFVQPSFCDSVSRNALFLPYKYVIRFGYDADIYNLF